MPTNRTPRHRAARTKITVTAIDLYEQGKRVMQRKPSDENHVEFVRIWNALHLELNFRPWVQSPLDFDPHEAPPFNGNDIETASWEQTSQAYEELERALRERRKAVRAAHTQRRGDGASAPPVPAPPIAAAPQSEE